MVTTEMLPTAVLAPMSDGLGVDETRTAQLVSLWAAVVVIAIALLAFVDRGVALGLVIVAAWGLLSGAVPPLAQTEILRRGGPEHRSTAGAIIPVLFNGGIAVGAALAALVVHQGGVGALPVPAAVAVALAAGGLAVVGVGQRSGELRK